MKKTSSYVSQKERDENLAHWVGYWRENPHHFVRDVLEIDLYLYQKILLYLMDKNSVFMYIAARGAGKSFIIAVYCVVRCILYPNTKVIVASGTKTQARLIISSKVVDLYNKSFMLRQEIGAMRNIRVGANNASVTFKNGSKIEAVTSSENARGYRGNILILDEFRLISKDIIQNTMIPMLNVVRTPPFMLKEKYRNSYPQEENKTIYISSAWYKSHWSWEDFKTFTTNMAKDKDYWTMATTYSLSIFHRLLSKAKARDDRAEYDQTKWAMEYEALFVGENEKSYFKLDEINKCRTITKTFIPPTNEEYLENQSKSRPKNLSNIPRQNTDTEIRIIGLDVALMGGNKNVKNDSSAFTCMRITPEKGRYRKDVLYLESVTGSISAKDLAIKLKRLYIDFEADYVVIDTNGIGTAVLESVCSLIYDDERDMEYQPWSVINNDEENERLKTKGLPVVYEVKATAKFNSDIAVALRDGFQKKSIRLPINDIEQREYLIEKGGFLKQDPYEQKRQLYSYYQATKLANELVSLEATISAGNLKIVEVGKSTKDRYTSIAYCNFYANKLEKELLNDEPEDEYSDFLFFNG